jgi:hypothetical protein
MARTQQAAGADASPGRRGVVAIVAEVVDGLEGMETVAHAPLLEPDPLKRNRFAVPLKR